ncbi:DUF2490 domain-containing protein [Legionella dresdenensis]|uniref:DUF2490 domain-containing protein n=1 Tax=Legionella dresdenensis TaxID=450200 RepID=A0ABV8CBM4_9GAMM
MSWCRKKLLVRLFVSILYIYSSGSWCTTQRDFQSWLNLTISGPVNKESRSFQRFKYWLEGQERIGDDSSRSSQTMFRTGIGYMLTEKASLWVGYAWIKTGIPFTMHPFTEDRIWEQLLWNKKTPDWNFSSRTRMEQRFTTNNHKVAYRVRQLLKIAIPIKNHPDFRLVGSDEIFWHTNNFIGRNGKGFDQNRLFAGIGYQFNPTISTEIGYMNQYIRRLGIPNFLNNILSINFFINF